ncbi:MAG: hypothetical protein ACK50Z_14445, partial [Betaproteobacteria bacterium]
VDRSLRNWPTVRSIAWIPDSLRLDHLNEALCTESVRIQSPGRWARIGLRRLVCYIVPGEQTIGVVQEMTIIAKRDQQFFD